MYGKQKEKQTNTETPIILILYWNNFNSWYSIVCVCVCVFSSSPSSTSLGSQWIMIHDPRRIVLVGVQCRCCCRYTGGERWEKKKIYICELGVKRSEKKIKVKNCPYTIIIVLLLLLYWRSIRTKRKKILENEKKWFSTTKKKSKKIKDLLMNPKGFFSLIRLAF